MTQEHPITPPPELVQKWDNDWHRAKIKHTTLSAYVATQAARWGADQELEACEKYWMTHGISPEGVARMREHRRPKPPSLKEQALKELEWVDKNLNMPLVNQCDAIHTIRCALEALDD